MKKFVSMETINNAFDDIHLVDYITVKSVTDSTVSLLIYLNTSKRIIAGGSADRIFKERSYILGKMLDRTVILEFVYATRFQDFMFKIKNWLT